MGVLLDHVHRGETPLHQLPQVEEQKTQQAEHESQGATKKKSTVNHAPEPSDAVIGNLAGDALPANVSTDLVERSLGENLSPLTAHSALLPLNPNSIPLKNNN